MGVSPGNDTRYSRDKVESARNFANKVWNASRFVLMNVSEKKPFDPAMLETADKWILTRLHVDIICFTAGIGENNAYLRERVIDGLEFMGAKIDSERNKTRSEAIISTDDSKVTVCVIPTNEEIMIARDTLDLVTTGKVRDN